MIGYLRGKLLEISTETALMDVQGVGYEVLVSLNTLNEIQLHLNQEIILWIYTHVREDALQLFGFSSKMEKGLFLSLLKVNGIGPKMALGVLSGAGVHQIQKLIETGDAQGLTLLPKIGKKTAEQIILTLRGKLVILDHCKTPLRPENLQEIMSALVNLGYKTSLVEELLSTLPAKIDVEEGIRLGLQILSGQQKDKKSNQQQTEGMLS